jgi:hypothetical protein
VSWATTLMQVSHHESDYATDVCNLVVAGMKLKLCRPLAHSTMSFSSSMLQPRLQHVLQITPVATSSSSPAHSTSAAPAQPPTLAEHLRSLTSFIGQDQALPHLLGALADASAEIAQILRASAVAKLTSHNTFGDTQLNVDVSTHQCVLRHLRASGVCATASSEEDPVRLDLSDALRLNVGSHHVYSVGFDPLDGSSIIDANFAVGSIFSVYAGRELLGQPVSSQKACAITLYGPRTSMIVSHGTCTN